MNTVFIDVDSQLDFLYPSGALYVPGAERIVPAIARLNRLAAQRCIPVISTTDAHSENDPEFAQWPPHCIAGTLGQHKAEATLLERHVVAPNRECPLELAGARQIVVEKQTVDTFQSLNLARIIAALNAGNAVVYGVVTEICVWYTVLGLRRLGLPVTVVTDAIKPLTEAGSRQSLGDMRALGVKFANVGQVINLRPISNRPASNF
jgi:nicotinamidase/pyrazinamidase